MIRLDEEQKTIAVERNAIYGQERGKGEREGTGEQNGPLKRGCFKHRLDHGNANTGNYADRFSHLTITEGIIIREGAAGFGVFILVINIFAS